MALDLVNDAKGAACRLALRGSALAPDRGRAP